MVMQHNIQPVGGSRGTSSKGFDVEYDTSSEGGEKSWSAGFGTSGIAHEPGRERHRKSAKSAGGRHSESNHNGGRSRPYVVLLRFVSTGL